MSGVLDVFAYGVGELSVFKLEGAALGEGLAGGGGDAEVEGAHAGLGGDVARDCEVDGKLFGVFHLVALLAALVAGGGADGGGVELAGDGYFVAELLVFAGEVGDAGLGLLVLLAEIAVVDSEGFVFAAEGVYLHDVVAEHLAQGGELFLEADNLACVVGFGALELTEKRVGALLLDGELVDERVVVDLGHHFVVLHGELLVFVLHLGFVHLEDLDHLLVLLLLVAHLEVHVCAYCCQYQGEADAGVGKGLLVVHSVSFCYIWWQNYKIFCLVARKWG